MRSVRVVLAVVTASLLALGACSSSKPPNLMNVRSETDGPDEFAILPAKPLELPENLAALPPPTPGGTNLTDQNPIDDAIVALGGKPNNSGKVAAADTGLYNYAARSGITPGIRQTLATEDYDFRRAHNGRILERMSGSNVYFKAYRGYALDQYAEMLRWRQVGVRTPSAPPPGAISADAIK
jgi:hypothetical protein